ncbi:TonB-linked SusC/RagA family outer membrane protein [Pedobacter metabolipauper]|uniref:TonB-linked SusC/RagA family outer membrane protein n=2 Tax=Pedobacter metabolipauper TaxID=425513 RepID=A0A4R6SQN9_9SPHI|nr:TonB-linked SusC/RagA family outer membrane protein [Pedobacter metabolipauper]
MSFKTPFLSFKTFLIMKLTAVFLLVTCLQLSAKVYSQNISLSGKNISFEQVLSSIEKQSGYYLFYKYNEIRNAKPVNIDFKNVTVVQALEQSFKDQPFDFVIDNKTIIITKKGSKKEISRVVFVDIKGKVTDEKGEPMVGATVKVKGRDLGAVTDSKGEFSISNIDDSAILIISYLGFVSQEVPASSKSGFTIILKEEQHNLDQIVVIGYGAVKKQDLSAAVSTVPDMQQIKNRPVLSVQSMIQGKVPGVTAVSNGGHPNSAPSLTIRGMGSRSGESVLYVVDGVPNAPYNPADVESITILKDAASAAIYGAFAGSSGVVLITTKQAAAGKTYIEYSGFTGTKTAWKLPKALTAEEEARVSNLAYTNAGLNPLDGWDAAKNPYAQVNRTDWVDEIFRTGIIQRHNVSINGGTEDFKTLLQGRYEREEGTLLNTYNENLSLRFNTSYTFNKHLKISQNLFWNNNDNRGTTTSGGYSGTILSAIYMPSSATPYYADGTFGGVGPRDSQYLGIHGDAINPVATLLRNKPFNKSSDLQSATELNVTDIVKGLSFLSRFSYRQNSNLYKNFEPLRTEPGKPVSQNYLSYSTGRGYQWIWENTLNYSRQFNGHSIGAMASMTSQEEGARGFSARAQGFVNEEEWAQFFQNAAVFSADRPGDSDWKDRNNSYVARLSYSYSDRYFLTGSYRYDIAGRLPEGNRAKGLPGVTAAWKLSSEPFFKVEGIDLLKFRASWGKIGNLGSIGRYYGYSTLSGNNTYQIGDGAPQSQTLYIDSRKNLDLSWETSRQTDIGVDISILKSRLNVTADYFDKLTYDLIKQQDSEWPNTYGLGRPFINQGEISNKGLEFSASWKDKAGDFTYEFGGNFATLKNRIQIIDNNPLSYWGDGDSWRGVLSPYRSTVGQPLYSYWLIRTAGIFQSDAEATAYAKDGKAIQPNAKAGDLKFVDLNNDGLIDDKDREYRGSAFPKITYGFTTNLNYKNFDFSLFLQGVAGVKLFHAFKESTLNGAEQGYNRWNKILDAWSPENPGGTIPRIRANDPNKNFQQPSDFFLENGDYLRIKNVLLGYTFKKMPWNTNLRIFFSGDNLLTVTKYSGMDPEVGGIGFDGGQFPVSRTYSLGLNLKF